MSQLASSLRSKQQSTGLCPSLFGTGVKPLWPLLSCSQRSELSMELGKQGLGCSPAPFTAQDAGEAEKENSEFLLPASRTGFNGFWQKGKEERTEDSEL